MKVAVMIIAFFVKRRVCAEPAAEAVAIVNAMVLHVHYLETTNPSSQFTHGPLIAVSTICLP